MTALVSFLKLPVHLYRLLLSPLLAPRCRFWPSCSAYALEALDVHGPAQGMRLTLKRLLRCHPWGGNGIDTVPPCRLWTEEKD